MSSKSRIVVLIAAVLVVVMGALGVTLLPARASADQNSEWIPTHATEEQLKGVLCYVDDPVSDGTSVRYYFRAEYDPKKAPTLTLDDGRTLIGRYDKYNSVCLGRSKCSKVVFKDYVKPDSIDFTYHDDDQSNKVVENKWLTKIEGIDKLDTSDVTNMAGAFDQCTALESIDLSHFDTSKVKSMQFMFRQCSSLKSIDISHLDMSACESTTEMFSQCSNLEYADIASPSTSSLANMHRMFENCYKLRSVNLDGLNTSAVADMGWLFSYCSSLESVDLSTLDTSKVKDMSMMFASCGSLKTINLDGFNTSSATNMGSMFNGCSSLSSLDVSGFDTANVTDMGGMFEYCKTLATIDVSGFNTANVTDMHYMFEFCSSLTSLDVSKFDTSKVKDMYGMFSNTKVKDIDVSHFDTSSVERMDSMFSSNRYIQYVDTSNFNLSSVKKMDDMFYNCNALKSVDMSNAEATNASVAGMFSYCSRLESVKLFHGTCSNMEAMFDNCTRLKSIDISTLSCSDPGNCKRKQMFNRTGLEELHVRGDLFSADANCYQALNDTQLKKITIVANSGELAVPDFHSRATATISGKEADSQTFGKGSETANETVDLEKGGTLAGGTEDTSWYLQSRTYEIGFYDGSFPLATYKVAVGDSFSGEAPGEDSWPSSFPPFMRLNGWYWYDGDGSSFDEVKASGALDHVDRDWYFDANLEWKDIDSEYHSTGSYIVRVPSKISYEHQKTGTVDISTAYDVSVSAFPIDNHKIGNIKFLELTTSLSGFDGLNVSVSDSSNSDISSRLVDIEDFTKPSDDGSFIAGKQFKDVLHLSGSVDSAKTITGHITYSCKPQAQTPEPDPTPEPGSGEGGGTAK